MLQTDGTDAYSGILQLRCSNGKKLLAILDFVRSSATPTAISKITITRQGYDVYISNKGFFNRMLGVLVKRFGGSIKHSKQLVTQDRQTSKRVYRKIAVLRAPPFEKGDVVSVSGKLVKITDITNRITGLDLVTGKRTSFKPSNEASVKKHKVYKAFVSQKKPKLKLLHPLTYQPVEPANIEAASKRDSYNVVVYRNRVYVIEP